MASEIGSTVFTYGKYRNQSFEEVRQQDAGYCRWVMGLATPNGQLKEFKQFLKGGPATAPGGPGPKPQPSVPSRGQFQQPQPAVPSRGQFQQPQRRQPHQVAQPTASTGPAARGGGPQQQPQTANSTLIVELLNANEFRIWSPAYLDSVVWQAVTGLKLGTWVAEKRHWVFAASQYDEVTSKLHGHPALKSGSVELPPNWVLAKFESFSRSRAPISRNAVARRAIPGGAGGSAFDEMPAKTRDKLMAYQHEGVQFGIAHGGRCLIGDEMGLGKTLQALGIVANYREDWPCLVVAPSSMRFVWRDQIVEWLEVQAEQVQVLTNGKEKLNGHARFVVVSYNLVAKQERFQKRADGSPYKTLIVDESHFVKEHKSQRTQATVAMCKSARRAIMLSGTATVNRAAEIYTQLDALMPGEIPSFLCFVERYCEQSVMHLPGRKVVKWTGSRCTGELNLYLSNSIMIRRLKKDVLSQLPDKTRQRLVLDESQMDKVAIKKLEQLMQAIDEKEKQRLEALKEAGNKEGDKDKSTALENNSHMFKLTSEAKAGAVLEHVEMLLDGDVKFLCFAHHSFMLDKIEQQLQRKRVDYIRIDGGTKQEARPELVNRFQQEESVRVAVLSITACGQGLTLTAASHVVFAELYWVPGQLLQAEDRVHRVGQKSACLIQYLIAPKTMDERIFKMINQKACVVNGILNGEVKGMMEPEPIASQQKLLDDEAKSSAPMSQGTQSTQQIVLATNDDECASATSSQQKSQMQVRMQQAQMQQQQQQQQQEQQQHEEVEKKHLETGSSCIASAELSQRCNAAVATTASLDTDVPCMPQRREQAGNANKQERAEDTVESMVAPEDHTEKAEPAKSAGPTEPAQPSQPSCLSGVDQPPRQTNQADEEHHADQEQCALQNGTSFQDVDTDDEMPVAVLIERQQDVQQTRCTDSSQPASDVVPGETREEPQPSPMKRNASGGHQDVQQTRCTDSSQPASDVVPGEKRKASGLEHASQDCHNESAPASNVASSSNSKDDQSVDNTQHAAGTVGAEPLKHAIDANLASAEHREANPGQHLLAHNMKQTTCSPSTNKRKADEHLLPDASVHRKKLPPANSSHRAAHIPGLRIASAHAALPLTAVSPVKGVPCAPRDLVRCPGRPNHLSKNVKGSAPMAGGFNHLGDQGAVKRRTLGQRLGAAGVGRSLGGS